MVKRFTEVADRVTPVLFFLAVFGLFSVQLIHDPDFWWHLETGRYIFETGSLPGSDPFSYAPFLGGRPGAQSVVLKGYWLSQLVFYLTVKTFGFTGINVLKSFLYTLIFVLQGIWMKKEGVRGPVSYMLMTFSVIVILLYFPGERPQIFTFLFSLLTVYFLEDFKKGGKKIVLLPLVMLIWANMHGGYVIGMGIALVYGIIEGFKLFSGRSALDRGQYSRMTMWLVISILASLINPNTYHALTSLLVFKKSIIVKDITEYSSVFNLMSDFQMRGPFIFALVILFLAAVAIALNVKKLDAVHVTILAGVLIGGFFAFRLFAFTVIIGVPVIGIYLGRRLQSVQNRALKKAEAHLSAGVRGVVVLLSVALIVLSVYEKSFLITEADQEGFPQKAVDFVLKHKIKGNIFNHYNWGGYLIWRLYPGYRVFIDGRGLSDEAYFYHNSILGATEGELNWESFLDSFGLNIILIPPVDFLSGEIFPLIPVLIESKNWRLVYYDEMSVVFIKDGSLNSDVLQIYSMPKILAYNTVIEMVDERISNAPQNPNFYIAKAIALRSLGMEDEARRYFDKAKEILPRVPFSEREVSR